MNSEVALFVGLVFLTVFLASQILVLPTMGTRRQDTQKLKKRMEGIILQHDDLVTSIVKEKYLNRLGTVERTFENLPGAQALKTLLEQAGVQQLAYRFALGSLFFSAAIAGIIWLRYHQWQLVLCVFVFVQLLIFMWLKKQKSKRFDKFEEQLPEALQMMSRALRTGYPFSECMKIVASEMGEPISQEFGFTYEEINYGRDVEVAFALMIQRIPSLSLIAMSTAILIQRETGGNLSDVLLKISAVLNTRFKLQRRIKTLTAEGVMSAWVMILLPFATFAVSNLANPDYYNLVYESPDRMTFLFVFLGLELAATIWIRIIINIDA